MPRKARAANNLANGCECWSRVVCGAIRHVSSRRWYVVRRFSTGTASGTFLELARGYQLRHGYVFRHFSTGTASGTFLELTHIIRELLACRTSAMGEHEWRCGDCGEQYVYFN